MLSVGMEGESGGGADTISGGPVWVEGRGVCLSPFKGRINKEMSL